MLYTLQSVPTWEQARESVEAAKGSAINRLIYTFAPTGELEEAFRDNLARALNEVVRMNEEEQRSMVKPSNQ